MILLGGAALLHSPVGRAQEPGRVYRLGFLAAGPLPNPLYIAFLDELHRSGFVKGQNLQIDERSLVSAEKASEIATTMIGTGVDAIVTAGAPLIRAVQKATRTVPILTTADDLVGSGLVRSFAHPGGNTTGISILATELDGKRQELLTELVPTARHIAALADPGVTVPGHLRALEDAARTGGIELSIYRVSKPEEIVPAIGMAQASGVQALNVLASPFFNANQQLILERSCARAAGDLSMAGDRGGRRPRRLWPALQPDRAAERPAARQNISRCQAGRHTGRAAGQIRAGDQSADGKGDRAGGIAGAARPCRQGHRMTLPISGSVLFSRRVVLLGGAATAMIAPLSWAQQPGRIYRLGVVVQPPRRRFEALFDELRRDGFVEGENLSVDPRGFGLAVDELETAAVEAAKAGPDAIYAGGAVAGRAAERATATIPIVATSDDMIRDHLVPSLAHPGGNLTGVSIFAPELDGKRLELLMEIVPGIRRIAALVDPKTTASDQQEVLIEAARSRGVELSIHSAETQQQIAPAIEAARAAGAQALEVLSSAFFNANRSLIIERIAAARLPAMYQWPEYAADGALIAYGSRQTSMYRQAGRLLAKVMTGTKPADLPVEQPTRFELVVNLNTAKALGLTIPQTILALADEVIE